MWSQLENNNNSNNKKIRVRQIRETIIAINEEKEKGRYSYPNNISKGRFML